jgi:hypothetical protein
MLRHKSDVKMKNNYVTITFVQFRNLAALRVGAYAEFTFKIRVFQRFRGGSGALFALVSTLHFGRLCPNYGRVCTFWGRKRASSCQLDLPPRLQANSPSIMRWAPSFSAKDTQWATKTSHLTEMLVCIRFEHHWWTNLSQINREFANHWSPRLQANSSLQYKIGAPYSAKAGRTSEFGFR